MTRARRILWAVMAAASAISVGLSPVLYGATASLTVEIVRAVGGSTVDDAMVAILLDKEVIASKESKPYVFDHLKPGFVYTVRAEHVGLEVVERFVRALDGDTWVLIGMPVLHPSQVLGGNAWPPYAVSGRAVGELPARGRIWVKLLSIYGSREGESLVTPSKEFKLRVGSPGEYLLLLLSGSRVLASQRISLGLEQADTVTQCTLRVTRSR